MGRHRWVNRPLVGWFLGVLLAFCAVLPVTSGSAGQSAAAPGAATLVRSGDHQHLEAVTAPQRPDVGRSTLHLSAATPADEWASPTLSSALSEAERAATAHSTSPTLSVARAPPSVRA